jgi:hypothetical protein
MKKYIKHKLYMSKRKAGYIPGGYAKRRKIYGPRSGFKGYYSYSKGMKRFKIPMAAGMKALQLIRKIKKEEELKYATFNTNITTAAADTWVITYIGNVTQGTGGNQRIGNKITIKSIQLRHKYIRNALEADGMAMRWAIIIDRRPSGTLATGSQIFDNNTDKACIANINVEPDYKGRFQILTDQTMEITNSINTSKNTRILNPFYIKKDIKIEYKGTAGDIADCQKNALLYCCCTSSASSSSTIQPNIKLRFTDT